MSIRRIVELILDRDAAERVKRGTKEALDKGTDPKKPTSNLRTVEGALNRLKTVAGALGLALGGAFVLNKVKQFATESVRVATEARGVWNRLAGQLSIAGVEYSKVSDEIERNARAMQDATIVGDEDFAAILQELLSTTNDYAASLREVETVADLAAAKSIDLRTAAQLVGRAMVGQTGTLSRYGIIVEEGADAMEVLRSRFAGMARNEARELEGQVAQLNNEWGDLKEAVGNALIEVGEGGSIVQSLTAMVKGLSIWIDDNRGKIVGWGRVVIATFKAVWESIDFVIRTFFNFGQIIGSALEAAALEIRQTLGGALNLILEALDKIPGVDLSFRINTLTPAEFTVESNRLKAQIVRDMGDIGDAVFDLGSAYLELGRAAAAAATGQAAASSGASSSIVAAAGGGAARGPLGGAIERRRISAIDFVRRPSDESEDELKASADRIRATYATLWAGMREDWERMHFFENLIDQTETTAAFMRDGFKGVGHSIVAQLIDGRAEEQFAAGLAALASGTWPPNPAALAAAGKHFAAAAVYRALGAKLHSAIGGGGGSGGGGGAGGRIGASGPTAGAPLGSEVHIYLDPLSPADPRFQRVALGAVQEAQDRFGENVRIQVHSRSGG